jgi:hypothetical protein
VPASAGNLQTLLGDIAVRALDLPRTARQTLVAITLVVHGIAEVVNILDELTQSLVAAAVLLKAQ